MDQKYNTIAAVVEQVLVGMGEMGGHRFQELLGYAYQGMQEFHLDAGRQVRVAKLTLCHHKSAQLPPGFIDWNKVSLHAGGQVRILDRSSGRMQYYALPAGGSDFLLLEESGERDAFFQVDLDAGKIFFSSKVSTRPVFLEYITDGLDYCDNMLVHPYLHDYLRKFIKHALAENDRNSTEARIYRLGEDLHYAQKKARGRVLGMTMAELMAISK